MRLRLGKGYFGVVPGGNSEIMAPVLTISVAGLYDRDKPIQPVRLPQSHSLLPMRL
jgi:hypothetical protein